MNINYIGIFVRFLKCVAGLRLKLAQPQAEMSTAPSMNISMLHQQVEDDTRLVFIKFKCSSRSIRQRDSHLDLSIAPPADISPSNGESAEPAVGVRTQTDSGWISHSLAAWASKK